MCTLIIAKNIVPGYPLVVAHNRDELIERPYEPPTSSNTALVAPRDAARGGTWTGLAGTGLVAAITNRMGAAAGGKRSRGLLCLDVLQSPSVAAAAELVGRQVAATAYDGFNLLIADATQARLLAHEGKQLTETELDDGVHVVTSAHHLNPPLLKPLVRSLEDAASTGAHVYETRVTGLLRSHEPLATGYAACKHLGGYGTVAAALIWLGAKGTRRFSFAQGPPCAAPLVAVV